ncbi:hypothetical protein WUBG_16853 [Wuchereria bancrofti]|uniref:EGF-like domain-containing protein n=1 Tax=Wuchereria bancrofti TaxID=6293 RepID=J9AE01_WUCBA|nr:hypothetical protein WUBG_16853 [Wuchereria bancrofti]
MEAKVTMLYYLILITFVVLFNLTTAFPHENAQKDSKEMEKIVTKTSDEKPSGSFGLIKTDEEAICEDELCNNRGTCIGNKDTNFCICRLGYTGMHCENCLFISSIYH